MRKLFDWAGYFQLKVEEVSLIELGNFSMNYLNVQLEAGQSYYRTRVAFKRAVAARRLGEDSVHPPHLKCVWPVQLVSNSMRLCTTRQHQLEAKAILLQRFYKFGASTELMAKLVDADLNVTCGKPRGNDVERWWCVVPYHPWYYKALTLSVNKFNSDRLIGSMFSPIMKRNPPRICLAWSNQVPLVTSLLAQRAAGQG